VEAASFCKRASSLNGFFYGRKRLSLTINAMDEKDRPKFRSLQRCSFGWRHQKSLKVNPESFVILSQMLPPARHGTKPENRDRRIPIAATIAGLEESEAV
jgi:hypothetical protein